MTKKYRKRRKKFMPNGSNSKTQSLMIDGASVVPDELLVKLRYNISGGHSGIGIINTTLSGNNPNAVFTGGTGENAAMGMQEWSQFYSKYQVLGSRLSLDYLVDTDPTLKKAVKVAVVPFTSPAIDPPTTVSQVAEMRYGKSKLLAENQNKVHNISTYMSSKKILGYHHSIDDLEFTHGNMASKADPTQTWVWQISSDTLGTGAYELQYDGYIDYYVRLFLRSTLPPSNTPP